MIVCHMYVLIKKNPYKFYCNTSAFRLLSNDQAYRQVNVYKQCLL